MKLFLLILLLAGCANQHIVDAPDISVPTVKVSHSIPIYFDTYDKDIHNMVATIIDQLPQVHEWLSVVYIVDEFSDGGRCNWFMHTITIKKNNMFQIRRVLWHELGHALQNTNLTNEQYKKWKVLAKKRLNEVGLDDFVGDDWIGRDWKSFPTNYALKNIWEYMADCFSQYKVRNNYEYSNPEEFKLMQECGWIKQ